MIIKTTIKQISNNNFKSVLFSNSFSFNKTVKESKLNAKYPMLPPEFDEKQTQTIFDDKSSILGCNLRLSVVFHSIFTESYSSCEVVDNFTPCVLEAFKSLVSA